MKNKKILIFSTAYYPFVGGAEVAIKEITDRIPGVQFDLITAKLDHKVIKSKGIFNIPERVGNINVYRVGFGFKTLDKILLPFWGAVKTAQLNTKNRYNAFWCVMATYAAGAAYLHNIFSSIKVPIILNLQEGDSEEYFSKKWFGMINLSWKMALKKTSYLTVLSQSLKDRAERFGYKGPVSIIPNGVDIKRFDIDLQEEERVKLREKLNIREEETALVTSSRLNIKNGVGDVIEALKILPTNVKFVICGTGELEKVLKSKVKELELENRVKFLGLVGHDELPKIIKACDIFIRPSLSEGFGVSFVEAMAARVPVIATPVGGIVDFLEDNKTGYFCQPQNPKSIADTVNRVINDVGENRIIENAYKMVKERYDWGNIAEQMEEVIDKLENPKRLKILLTTGIFPPEIGGPATYSALLEKELPNFGIEVEVLPFRVVRNLPKVIRHLAFFFKVLKQGSGKDLLYSQDPVSVGFPTMLAAKILRKPFLVRIAGDYAWEQASQRFGVKDTIDDFQNKKYGWKVEVLKNIQTLTARNADKVINPSKYFCNLVSNWSPGKINAVPIYNGIDFKEIPIPKQSYEPKTIISAGRLIKLKNFDFLIKTMKDLPEWKLFIAGEGPDKVRLEEIIKNLNLKDKVFMLGNLDKKSLVTKMQDCEIFVICSASESFSFVTVEAMRAKVPVVATKVGGLSEVVENGKDGLLVEPNNQKELLEAINKLQNSDFRNLIVKAALKKSEMFSVENTLSKTSEVIKELIK